MTMTYQRFTAVLSLIYGSLFLSGIYNTIQNELQSTISIENVL